MKPFDPASVLSAARPSVAASPAALLAAPAVLASLTVDHKLSRVFFAILAAGAAGTVALTLLYRDWVSAPAFAALVAAPIVMLAVLWLAVGLARRGRHAVGYFCALAAAHATVTALALFTQVGVHAVTFGFFALIVVVAGVVLSAAAAMAFGVLCAAALIGLYWAETAGIIGGAAAVAAIPVLHRLLASLLVIAVSMLVAALLARLVVTALRESTQQERRFRTLLGIAANWYWEQDADLRFTQVSSLVEASTGFPAREDIGRTRWELLGADPGNEWDAHRADLAARRAFRDFRFCRIKPDGHRVEICVSGEPMFDASGRFTGYWGVARDVTDEEHARAALQAGDQRFRELFLLSPSPFILHRRGRALMGNRAAAALFGFGELGDFENFDLAQLTSPEDRALSVSRIATLEQLPVGGAVPTVELKMLRLDGEPLTVEARMVRVELADGPASLSLYFDLTERKRAEAALRHSRAMLSRLFQASPDYITVSDIDTSFLEMVNEGFERLSGYSAAEAIGRTAFELNLWPHREDRQALIDAVREHGIARDVPATLRRRDGELRKVLFGGARFELDGRTWLVATARDITVSEQQRLQYEAILGSAAVGVAYTRARIFEHANLAFEQMFGWGPGELVGQPGAVVWQSDDDYAEMGRAVGPALARGGPVDLERAMRRRDGSTFLCRLQGRVVDPRAPQSSGTIWIAEDVTERRAEQQRLAHSEALLSLVVEANPDYVALSELDSGKFIVVNEGFTRMTGYARSEALGRGAVELGVWFDPNDRDNLVAQLRALGSVRGFPARLRCKDGRVISTLISSATFVVEGRALVTSTARDVTDSERARLEYEAILSNALIGIAFTRNRVFLHANPRWEEMYGWPVGTLTGQPGSVVWLSDEDYADVSRTVGPALARGEPIEVERRMRRRDGSVFWCRLLGRALDPTQPGSGGTIWIAEDVTERRATQQALAAAKADAEAASRAKSAFLANTSHEIRTPLNGLLGLARLALENKASDAQRLEYLKGIHESAEQLGGLISDILDLSKIEAGKLTLESVSFDLHAMLGNVYAGYRELAAEKGLACTLHLDPRVPQHVSGDPTRVRQILSNFVTNALKFTERGHVDLCAEPTPAGRVRLAVVDTGIGIDEAIQTRLFSPFMQADESTTRRYGGTGLGLSICKQLADLMGGAIGVDSEHGVGSSFWAELPLAAAAARAAPVAADESSLDGIRVLLVEDNAVNMLIAATMLESWGAEIEQVTDGRQAVEIVGRLQNDPATAFDLVLMDVHMPVMSGHEATILLRKRFTREQLPIVALTAAALLNEQEASLALGMNDFVTKPVDAPRLRSVIARWARSRVT